MHGLHRSYRRKTKRFRREVGGVQVRNLLLLSLILERVEKEVERNERGGEEGVEVLQWVLRRK